MGSSALTNYIIESVCLFTLIRMRANPSMWWIQIQNIKFVCMKQVHLTINVPDQKFDKLIEFRSQNFGPVKVNESEDFNVPDWHQEIVLKRIKNAKEEDFFPLEDLDSNIFSKDLKSFEARAFFD